MDINKIRDGMSLLTTLTCLGLVPPAVKTKELPKEFFVDLAMKAGGIWCLGRSNVEKEAYGRGMYQFMFHAMPDWMYLLCEHAADHGTDEDAAELFNKKHNWILPDDAEKFCLYWDRIIRGMTTDEIIEIDSQIPDDDEFEDPILKEMEDM